MAEAPNLGNISTRQQRIAQLAQQLRGEALNTLSHYIDLEWLYEAYRRTRKDGAVGIDGQSAAQYGENLDENLRDLLARAKSGRYRAPAVRRVHIPKGDGTETRPIGIPTFEDKVLQRAVVMVLESIWEQDFANCSYGFRPGRSAHQALSAFREPVMEMKGCWVIEVDIRKYFDEVDHSQLRSFVRRRVRDAVLLRLIGKWLKAGVLEQGRVSYPESGTPQGGVVSPLLANIYLHEVLDTWFEQVVKPRMKGKAFMVRYADDALLCFEYEDDARRVMKVLPKRFEKFGLRLHPDKTRLVRFKRPPKGLPRWSQPDRVRPGTFDFLGFTHYWSQSLKGNWVIKRKTAASRFRRVLGHIAQRCAQIRHWPVRKQHADLSARLQGHYGYYGITGNSPALARLRFEAGKIWAKWLRRRSQRRSSWTRVFRIQKWLPLPAPIPVHSILRHAANP